MKYKGFLLATAGGVAGLSGAQAADLPMKAAPYAPMPVATWTGFYVGLSAGGGWQFSRADYNPASDGGVKADGGTFIGGGQIGYNWQAGSYVYGLEADISGLLGKATSPAPFDSSKGNAVENKITWLSTFRGRFGMLLSPNTMVYATGGLAVGGIKDTWSPNGLNSSCNQAFCSKSVSKTKAGWTVGGGFEYMVNPHWTVGVEGLYVDLGKTSAINSDASKSSTFSNTMAIARLKLNYKF